QPLAVAGPSGGLLVAACVVSPFAVRISTRAGLLRPARRSTETDYSGRDVMLVRFAAAGLALVGLLAAWQAWLLRRPFPDPLVHSNRLALHWVEDRWRRPPLPRAGPGGPPRARRLPPPVPWP